MKTLTATCLAVFLAAAAAHAEMALTSPDFADGGTLPDAMVLNGFGCTGGNGSPGLAWSGAPEGTGSFVLSLHDPDAPTASGWWHWSVYNLPADTTALPRGAGNDDGALPDSAGEAVTDFGKRGYGGGRRRPARRTATYSRSTRCRGR